MAKTFSVHAGKHKRRICPVFIAEPDSTAGSLRPLDGDVASLPLQPGDGGLWAVLPELPAGVVKRYALDGEGGLTADGGVQIEKEPDTVHISLNKKLITSYHFGSEQARPFFHPVIGPEGLAMTRAWPIVEGVEGEETDHIHHRSFYVAHGLVNGSDHWEEKPDHGWQRHEDFLEIRDGLVFGGFTEKVVWTAADGKQLLEETREFRLWNVPEPHRLFDLSITFTASCGDVLFGDTKEGGICTFRVAESMKEKRTGLITNAYGGVGEKECWGQRSPWVDYSGRVEDRAVGVTIMDHRLNPHYPTCWHVRAYGLFSANPFGLSHFKSSYDRNGDWTLTSGSSAAFRYRLFLHPGNAEEAGSAQRFQDWINPPSAEAG